jgi:hypothetical protein
MIGAFCLARGYAKKFGHPWLGGPRRFDHVLGDARLRDLKSELEQFAVNAWRAPKWIFDAHPPDQNAQLRLDLRSPSVWARLPTQVAAKAGPVPTHQRLGTDDRENLQDRRKPPIQLNKEPTIVVRQPWPTAHLAPQNDQLWSTAFSASSRLFDLNGEAKIPRTKRSSAIIPSA